MNGLGLCAGVGGLELGLKLALGDAYRTVAYVEIEAYCTSVLQARFASGHLCPAPIWDDVASFDGRPWRGVVDIIAGGFPCQPFSEAGKRRGADDPRHLWPHFVRHIQAIEPALVFCENVPGLVTLGLEQVCEDLSKMGYCVEAGIYSAAELGAPHLRKRLFFVAYAQDAGRQAWTGHSIRVEQAAKDGLVACEGGQRGDVANANCSGQLQQARLIEDQRQWPIDCGINSPGGDTGRLECRLGGPTDGPTQRLDLSIDPSPWGEGWEDGTPRTVGSQPFRADRLRALGNAVVPQVAAYAFTDLMARIQSQA